MIKRYGEALCVTDVIYTAAIYDKRLRGDKTRLRCSEECNRMGNIVRLADASHHRALAELMLHFGPLFLAAPGLRHIRAHEPRRDRIHSYAMRTKLQCETAGQDNDLGLCGGIKRRARQRCAKCGDRGYVDYSTISELAHAAHHGKRRMDHPIDVNSPHALELLLIIGVERSRLGVAGIVDEDSDGTKFGSNALDHRGHGLLVSDIRQERDGSPAIR